MPGKTAVVRHITGLKFIGHADSGHEVVLDSSDNGGPTTGTSPMEMVLVALAACTGSDVASILRKKRARISSFFVDVSAERAEEHPRVYTSIHVRYTAHADRITGNDLQQAIDLSVSKYCSVSAMLKRGGVSMTTAGTVLPFGSEEPA